MDKIFLMPCNSCIERLESLGKFVSLPLLPVVYCDHGTSVGAVIFRGYLCLREAGDENQATRHAMSELEKISVKEAIAVLWQAMADLPDDVKEPLEEAMRRLMEAKPE